LVERVWFRKVARVAAALCVMGVAGTGAPATAASVPTLAGTNDFSGDRSGGMQIDLPSSVTFNPGQDIELGGSARFAAFVLAGNGFTAMAWLEHFCELQACPRGPAGFNIDAWPSKPDGTATLMPGRYTVFLVSSGGAVTARLHLPGRSGDQALRPSGPANVTLIEPPSNISQTPSGAPAYIGGATVDAVPGAVVLYGIAAQGTVAGTMEIGACGYTNTSPPPVGAYGPDCPGGGYGATAAPVFAGAGPGWISDTIVFPVGAAAALGPGSWGMGGHFFGVGVMTDIVSEIMVVRLAGARSASGAGPARSAAPAPLRRSAMSGWSEAPPPLHRAASAPGAAPARTRRAPHGIRPL
jgi:hypothetical protein